MPDPSPQNVKNADGSAWPPVSEAPAGTKPFKLILKDLDEPGYTPDIGCYQRHGGYEALKRALAMPARDLPDGKKLSPQEALREDVKASGLRGRGGAGFSAGLKWSFVDRRSGKPIYLICNADESEPGTFKDRQILHKDPHQLIEGMIISCWANDVKLAYIYIRGEMPHGAKLLNQALNEARAAGFLGQNILGTGYDLEIHVHRGAGAYICGEETGLIESLEGKRAYPRIKPPYFPAVLGLYMCPTIVNNVETLCHVKHIVLMGPAEYAKLGTPNNTGTRIVSLSGDVQQPGYYEIQVGRVTLGELIFDKNFGGGLKPGRSLKAIIPGGSSSKVLKAGEVFKLNRKGADGQMTKVDVPLLDLPYDFDSLQQAGTMSGSSAIIVLDDSRSMVETLGNLSEFYAHESCGQCTPCREGALWLAKATHRLCHGEGRKADADYLTHIAQNIQGRTICAFGEAASWPVLSFVKKFRDEFEAQGAADEAARAKAPGSASSASHPSNATRPAAGSLQTHGSPMSAPAAPSNPPAPAPAPAAPAVETMTVKVNGKTVQVPKTMPDWQGKPAPTTMLQAARIAGVDIPHYCYHDKLPVAGNCRMCLVEFGTPMIGPDRKPVLNEDGTPKIAKSVLPYEPGTPRGAIACATPISPGMEIYADSKATQQMRESVLESLLINHPLDCPICDQAGECKLQEYSVQHGKAGSQFVETKVHKPKAVDLGPRIVLDDERCILCTRCIRFTRDIAGDDALGIVNRGSYNTIAAFKPGHFDNNYTLNTVDLCPVGALTSKDFRFKMRVWFLKETKSLCTSCGTGCNITIGSREGVIHRYEPRENDAVNGPWMCDSGRLNYRWVGRADRLKEVLRVSAGGARERVSWNAALESAALILGQAPQGGVAFVVSARQTNEELFLLKKLATRTGALTDSVPRDGEPDRLLVSEDRNPNSNGVRLTGMAYTEFGFNLPKIADGIAQGRIKTLVVFGEDVTRLGIGAELLAKLDALIVSDILPNATTAAATLLLPGAAHAEKRGTFVNVKGRLQKFQKAAEAPGDARAEWEFLHELVHSLTGQNGYRTIEGLFNQMAAEVPAFAGLEWAGLGDTGVTVQI